MSLDYDDVWARAADEHTFSNSTEFEIWSSSWCAQCAREAPLRAGLTEQPCVLTTVAFFGRRPLEWLPGSADEIVTETGVRCAKLFHCVEFRPSGGSSGEPTPRPEPPQEGLFPRPQRHTRMLAQPTLVDTETL